MLKPSLAAAAGTFPASSGRLWARLAAGWRWTSQARPSSIPAGGRDVRLDLFRGLALWFIFLDHIPGNIVNAATLRNFGFSDATEIFVFISGYTVALVYGRAMREQGALLAGARIVKRAWQIYVAHVFLFMIYAAAIVLIASTTANPLVVEQMGLARFLQEPGITFVQVLLLRFKPANMDVLPMYIAVLIAFAPMLWLLVRRPHIGLIASLSIYALARRQEWNFSSASGEAWYFNPFAWQLLFVFGAWCALGGAARLGGLIRSRVLAAAAAAYLVFALAIVLTWRVPALADAVPPWLCALIYPIDKTNLDVLRIAHFFALAVITVRAVDRNHPALKSPLLRPITQCGMHSLEIFCLGVLLSFIGHAALVESSGGAVIHLLVSAIGIATLIAAAKLIAWGGSLEEHNGSPQPAGSMHLQPVRLAPATA